MTPRTGLAPLFRKSWSRHWTNYYLKQISNPGAATGLATTLSNLNYIKSIINESCIPTFWQLKLATSNRLVFTCHIVYILVLGDLSLNTSFKWLNIGRGFKCYRNYKCGTLLKVMTQNSTNPSAKIKWQTVAL